MLPMRFDPTRELSTLQQERDDLFMRMFGSSGGVGDSRMLHTAPAINSDIKEGAFHLEAEFTGVETDKLDITTDDGDLVIRGD